MKEIKHTILSRCRFADKDLMQKYLDVCKKTLIPALKGQTEKDFTWIVMCRKVDEQFIREYLLMDFTPVYDIKGYINFVKENNVKIQTRHDIDDYMSNNYIEAIQGLYDEHIGDYDKFLVQAQPRKVDLRNDKETKMGRYHEKRTSMFLSLCQRECTYHINEKKHGQMWMVAPRVFTLPEGYTKWMIHGDNVSCHRAKGWKPTNIEESDKRIGEVTDK